MLLSVCKIIISDKALLILHVNSLHSIHSSSERCIANGRLTKPTYFWSRSRVKSHRKHSRSPFPWVTGIPTRSLISLPVNSFSSHILSFLILMSFLPSFAPSNFWRWLFHQQRAFIHEVCIFVLLQCSEFWQVDQTKHIELDFVLLDPHPGASVRIDVVFNKPISPMIKFYFSNAMNKLGIL